MTRYFDLIAERKELDAKIAEARVEALAIAWKGIDCFITSYEITREELIKHYGKGITPAKRRKTKRMRPNNITPQTVNGVTWKGVGRRSKAFLAEVSKSDTTTESISEKPTKPKKSPQRS